jgi:hypothetical protein
MIHGLVHNPPSIRLFFILEKQLYVQNPHQTLMGSMFEFIQASWVDNRTIILYTLTNE